jgi:hypothetical protein
MMRTAACRSVTRSVAPRTPKRTSETESSQLTLRAPTQRPTSKMMKTRKTIRRVARLPPVTSMLDRWKVALTGLKARSRTK